MDFQTSTHKRKWIFTPEALESARAANWSRGLAAIAKARQELESNNAEAPPTSSSSSTIDPPTRDDERTLVDFYSERAAALSAGLGAPRKVASTALIFLRRFYTKHSALEHDPKDAMLSAVYVAAKAEESYISAERLAAAVGAGAGAAGAAGGGGGGGASAGLLRREPVMLQALDFDLLTYLPHRALEGFWADVGSARVEAKEKEQQERQKGQQQGGGGDEKKKAPPPLSALGAAPAIGHALAAARAKDLASARKASLAACDVLMRSDAPLIFTPGQIALAAMRSGLKKAGVKGGLPREFLERAATRAAATAAAAAATAAGGATAENEASIASLISRLEASLTSLDALGAAAATPPTADAARAADARVRTARSALAAAQRAAAAAADAGASEARTRKIAAKRAAAAAREAELLGTAPPLRTDEEVAAMKAAKAAQKGAGGEGGVEGGDAKRRKSEIGAVPGGGGGGK